MALAEVNTTILDGALGLATQDISATSAKVGICSGGTVNTITLFTRPRDIKNDLGTGPLVEAGCYHVQRSRKPVYLCPIDGSVVATTSSVTKSNSSSPTMTVSGSARDTYSVGVRFTQDGVVGSGTGSGAFVYYVDGGDSESPEIAMPAASENLAQVTGTTDMTTAGLYGGGGTLNGTSLDINVDAGGNETVTFSSPANAAAVVSAINTAVGVTAASLNSNNRLVLSGSVSIVLADGTPGGALALLGLDAGTTNATPGTSTYALADTGLTLTFPQGNYTAGDTYTFTTTEPSFSLSDLQDALDVFVSDNQKQYFCIHVVGAAASAAAARAMADSLDTYASDFEALHRFIFFVMETPSAATAADLLTEFADFESRRVAVSFGYCELTSEATRDQQKRVFSRPSAWPAVQRWAARPISEKAAYVGRGKLEGVVSVAQATLDDAEQMSDARFLAIREVIGKNGYFLAEDAIMAPVGSDFAIVPYRRIMDVACRVVREGLLNYLQASILVDATTGYIVESVAQAIESDINSRLKTALVNPGHASSAAVVVTRDNNILSTQELLVETRVTPVAYAKTITHTIGFVNPTIVST